MLIPLLQELVSSTTLPKDPSKSGTMVTGAASLTKWLAGLWTLQGVIGAPSAPILRHGQLGAVASESDICSHIGTDLLKHGGNAADAMVGTVACVGVVGMYHSGKCT
jgi:gamma-glutamyltranspeptidase/glutathione hydrolase